MQKYKLFTRQLTISHIIHFVFIIVVLVVINFVLLHKTLNIYIDKSMYQKITTSNQLITERIKTIEYTILLFENQTLNEISTLNYLLESIGITQVEILDGKKVTNKEEGWKYFINQNSEITWQYCLKTNNNKYIVASLNNNWLNQMLTNYCSFYPYEYFFYNADNIIISSNNLSLIDKNITLNSNSSNVNISEQYTFNTKVSILDNKIFYKIIYTDLNALNLKLAVSHPKNFVFKYLGHYVAIILLVVAFLLVLIINVIIKTNKRISLTINDIIQTIKKSKFLDGNIKNNSSDLILIKRSVESLINQLNFYEKKLYNTLDKNQKIENDIEIAKKLQKSILPKYIQQKTLFTHKVQIATLYDAAFDIGGDLYDYFMLDDDHLLLAVGDISGKGIPASLFMIYTQTLLRSIAKSGMSVAEIVDELNNRLSEGNTSELFVTMLIGILNINTGNLMFCNAAHNLPLIIRSEGTIEELNETHGIPMGIYPNKSYSLCSIKLNYNDCFLIYTDGIVDSKDENGMSFSVEVLKYNLMGTWFLKPTEIVEKIKQSILNFRGNIPPVDDITMLVMRYQQQEEK